MDTTKIIELASYTIPAIITGTTAYFLFSRYFEGEDTRRRYELLKENQKLALPLRLQAYERMVLFLERINPAQLLIRVSPNGLDTQNYATLLVHSIQTEFEHNLTQQIYLTNEAWEIILKAKNGLIIQIRNKSITKDITSADEMRTAILKDLTEGEAPSDIAIAFLKTELKKFF